MLGRCEARGVRHALLAGEIGLVGVGGEGVEPGDAEEGGVQGVDDAIEGVQVGKKDGLKRRLQPDVAVEEACREQREGRVNVHGQLEAVDRGARDDGEQPVDTRDFVDNLQVGDDLRASAQGHALEKCLQFIVSFLALVHAWARKRTRGRGISRMCEGAIMAAAAGVRGMRGDRRRGARWQAGGAVEGGRYADALFRLREELEGVVCGEVRRGCNSVRRFRSEQGLSTSHFTRLPLRAILHWRRRRHLRQVTRGMLLSVPSHVSVEGIGC